MIQSTYLWLAVISALFFLILRWRPFFTLRPLIKAAMAIFLAVHCLLIPTIPLYIMAAGFVLSALGDYFLDLREEKWFLLGLIAFFTAHIAFAVYLFEHMVSLPMFTPIEWGLCTGLIVVTIAFYIWLLPVLPKNMKIPVAAYSLIITIMGVAALTTTLSLLVPLGALLFIASDIVLAIERFKFTSPLAKKINWVLYAGGQILLALGVTVVL